MCGITKNYFELLTPLLFPWKSEWANEKDGCSLDIIANSYIVAFEPEREKNATLLNLT